MYKLFVICSLCTLLISCSSTPKPEGKTEAEVLYKEAKQLLDEGYYTFALEKINQLRNQHPYSFYVTPSELLQADIMFKQEDYAGATAAYLLFRDFHPKHEKIPYVVYQIGESYYKQIPVGYDKDLESAHLAVKYFREVSNKYSSSSFAKESQQKVVDCQTRILKKEKYVADFYFKTKKFSAARWRYLDILKKFSSKDIVDHSKVRIVESSSAMNDHQLCVEYAIEYKDSLEEKSAKYLSELMNLCQNKVGEDA